MANFNIFKATIKSSFSFGKLKRSSNKIIRETLAKVAEKSVETTKTNLDKLRSPALKPFTKIMRKKGRGWSNQKVGTTSSTKPLNQTGTLRKSIRYNKAKNSLEMKAYGFIQNKGFISQNRMRGKGMRESMNPTRKGRGKDFSFKQKFIKVPARPFIAIPSKETVGYFFGRSRKMTIGKEIRKIHFMKFHRALKKRK